MEMLYNRGDFVSFVATALKNDDFVLVDVGCGGGIDAAWRVFGDRLKAVGFDPNVDEIERLQKAEPSSKVQFKAAFVGVPVDNPIRKRRGERESGTRNPWNWLAVGRTVSLTAEQNKALSPAKKVEMNFWELTNLAEPAQVYLPNYLDEVGFEEVDFIKIDIDSDDFDVLQSLEESLVTRQVLGVCAEVNFYGSDDPTSHTFHNTDRFMRKNGFDLFGLVTRTYSAAALPQRYLYRIPAESKFGRPYQGDALYIRDVGSPEWTEFARPLSNTKLLKLAALYSLFGLPDFAAHVLVAYRAKLKSLIDIEHALDLLVAETEIGRETGVNFNQLIEEFEANSDLFYPAAPSTPEPALSEATMLAPVGTETASPLASATTDENPQIAASVVDPEVATWPQAARLLRRSIGSMIPQRIRAVLIEKLLR